MGAGIEAAKEENPEHAELIENIKEQLLIVFLKRLGGKVSIPVSEINDTGQDLFLLSIDQEKLMFNFEIRKKS